MRFLTFLPATNNNAAHTHTHALSCTRTHTHTHARTDTALKIQMGSGISRWKKSQKKYEIHEETEGGSKQGGSFIEDEEIVVLHQPMEVKVESLKRAVDHTEHAEMLSHILRHVPLGGEHHSSIEHRMMQWKIRAKATEGERRRHLDHDELKVPVNKRIAKAKLTTYSF